MKITGLALILINALSLYLTEDSEAFRLDNKLSKCQGIDIRELTIIDLHNYYYSEKLTAAQLTACYIARIKALNPYLNAVIEINPDALKIAKKLDENSYSRGLPLFGVPILVKDNIATDDKMETCAGSRALLGLKPKQDAEIIKKLRKAGAIILGKTNLSEFAGFRASVDVAGWSGRGNQTHNPYVLSATATGSSSGSGVAVSANLAMAALGSETDGSIIAPSTLSSIVGLKPTVGATSGDGVIPLAPSQDSVGAMTRTVDDNLRITAVIVEDKKMFSYGSFKGNFCKAEGRAVFKKLRIGILRNPYFNPESIKGQEKDLEQVIKGMSSAGVKVVDFLTMDASKVDGEKELTVLKFEFKHYLKKYLTEYVKSPKSSMSSLKSVIDYNIKNKDTELNIYDQSMLIDAQAVGDLSNSTYQEALKTNQREARKLIDDLIKKHCLDGLLAPTNNNNMPTAPSAVAGYPIITVPIGYDTDGIPYGVTVFGKKNTEKKLLRLAKAIECTKANKRALPTFKKCCSNADLNKSNSRS